MNNFGELIRAKREEKEMLLRHLAAQLDIDTAQLSKMERGERTVRREHVLACFNFQSRPYKSIVFMVSRPSICCIVRRK